MFELLSAGYKTERGFMKKGEIYEGIIEKVEFPNKGFVWVDDQKVIVKNGIPGQKVRFMINKKRSGRAEGRLLEVLEKSPLETREPACQEFPACGGCMYQTMSYEAQKDMKEHQVKELLDGRAWLRSGRTVMGQKKLRLQIVYITGMGSTAVLLSSGTAIRWSFPLGMSIRMGRCPLDFTRREALTIS